MATDRSVALGSLLFSDANGSPPRRVLPTVKSKSALARCTENGGALCRDFMVFNLSHGCLAARVLLRSLFFSMILLSIPLLCLIRDDGFCVGGDACGGAVDCALLADQNPSSLPVESHGESSIVQLKQSIISYDEHLQLQLRRTQYLKLKKLWTTKAWRQKVEAFSDIFQALLEEGLLNHENKVLCIGAGEGEEVMAMKEVGMQHVIGIDSIASPPLVRQGNIHKQPFSDSSFDFEFSDAFDTSTSPSSFVAEIERTLKTGGIAAMLVSLAKWQNNVLLKGRLVDPVTLLFSKSKIVHVRRVELVGLDTLIVFKKFSLASMEESSNPKYLSCMQNGLIMEQLESLVTEEPSELWIASRNYLKSLKYLPNISSITPARRHVYIDIGAGHINSSINGWFMVDYPKSMKKFEIFAIEMDRSFESSYTLHPEIKFLPYVAWIRNESLHFKAKMPADGYPVGGHLIQETASAGSWGMKAALRDVKLQGLDVAEWLKCTFSVDDFVVLKIDVGGMEFELLPRLLESGAMCLIDELFLECHYSHAEATVEITLDYKRRYEECVGLYQMLRENGVVVHQWWW